MMVSAINWIKLSKKFGKVFPKTSLVIYLLNLGALCAYQRIRVVWISKFGWKLLTNRDSIWVLLFHKKYIKYGNLLSCPLSSGSWIWNRIKSTASLLAQGACFIPHNNSSLLVWSSPWIPTLFNFLPVPRLPYFPSSYPLHIADLIFFFFNLEVKPSSFPFPT